MDSTKVFCPNEACPARGQVGQGNITVHDRKKRRYRRQVCKKPFSERKGTPFYRRRTASETVTLVLKLLAHGCPVQAIVFAFGFDERTVMDGLARAGRHGERRQEHLVGTPRRRGEVQMEEIRLKRWHRVGGWMALAIEVPTRLWWGGAVAPQRDAKRLRTLVERVKRGSRALGRGLLFVTDGLAAYVILTCISKSKDGLQTAIRRPLERSSTLLHGLQIGVSRSVSGLGSYISLPVAKPHLFVFVQGVPREPHFDLAETLSRVIRGVRLTCISKSKRGLQTAIHRPLAVASYITSWIAS